MTPNLVQKLLFTLILSLPYSSYAVTKEAPTSTEHHPQLETAIDDSQVENVAKSLIPKAFTARYAVSINGLPTGLSAYSQLRTTDDHHFLLSLSSESWIMDYEEKAAFTWNKGDNCSVRPEVYQFSFEGFKVKSNFEVAFDYQRFIATSRSPKEKVEFEIPPKVSDALSYLLKLQCDLRAQIYEPTYLVGYEGGLDNYVFKYLGREEVKTPLGKFNTIKLERVYPSKRNKTTYWIAPELDYFMVRMKHREGKIVRAKLSLKEFNFLSDLEEDKTERTEDAKENETALEETELEDEATNETEDDMNSDKIMSNEIKFNEAINKS